MRNDNDGAERAESTTTEQARSASPELGSHGSFHTPGPWRAEFGENRGYDCMTDAWHVSGAVGGGWPAPIATIDLSHYGQSSRTRDLSEISKRHAEADARLIAAAPDLYAALVRARSALQANEDTGAWELYQHSPEMLAIDAAIAKAEGRI